jgi:CheY-like chemotaxis protein
MLLVADDHADTREILVRLLKRDGYDVAAVESGEDAMAYLSTSKPALVILDHSMPGMDGLQVLERMKQDPRLADVPVIMFSAHESPIREQAVAAGVSAYVLKASLDWSVLRAQILRLAGPGDRPASTTQPHDQPKRHQRSG